MGETFGSFWGPLVIGALVAFAIDRRFRRSFGRQPVRPRRMTLRLTLFTVVGVMFLPGVLDSFALAAASIGGLAAGIGLGVLGAKRVRFLRDGDKLFYIPHTYTGIAVTALFLGRIGYRLASTGFNFLGAAATPAEPAVAGGLPALGRLSANPTTRGVLYAMIGYYVVTYAFVLCKSRRLTPDDLEPMPSQAVEVARTASLVWFALLLSLLVPGCAKRQQLDDVSLRVGDRDRAAHVLLPENGVAGQPLLLLLHGGGGTGKGLARHLRDQTQRLLRERRWVIAFPDGIGRSWNDGRMDVAATAFRENVDDVGFLRALALDLVRKYGLNVDRVYVAGISNGGFMAQRLACEAADVFAGVASVAAQMSADVAATCRPSRPIAVALLNGTKDPLVPYDGGDVLVFGKTRGAILSTMATNAFWRAHNGCTNVPITADHRPADPGDPTRALSEVWRGCEGASVGLVSVEGGGHAWPGAGQVLPRALVGRASGALDALAWIAAFWAPEAR